MFSSRRPQCPPAAGAAMRMTAVTWAAAARFASVRVAASARSAGARLIATALLFAGIAAAHAQPAERFPGIGRAATAKELAAWDIDVRPDFKGLPAGSGSVARGQEIWEAKCESCHGVFGESNQTFMPLIGGTTAKDIETGRVARLTDQAFPGRTTMMKLSSVATLWDYIRRAMPWTQPKSLSPDEVYAVTAYLLNLAGVLPDDFTMTDRNIADVQKRLPNRNGMTFDHALWPGRTITPARKPDVAAIACMSGCATEPKVASFLPDHARNAHGNLAEQNRLVGPQRGANTAGTAAGTQAGSPPPAAAAAAAAEPSVATLTQRHACAACHGMFSKIVGPSFRDIAGKYADRADAAAYLAGKIKSGSSGIWGSVEMPPQSLGEAEAMTLARWLAEGANPDLLNRR